MNLKLFPVVALLLISIAFSQEQKSTTWLSLHKSSNANSAIINNDTLYICTDGEGLILVDLSSKKTSSFQTEKIGLSPRMIKIDKNGIKYILCSDSLIVKFDQNTGSKIVIPANTKASKDAYSPNEVTSMVVTSDMIIITKESCVQIYSKGSWKTYVSSDGFAMNDCRPFIDSKGKLWVYNNSDNFDKSKEAHFAFLTNGAWHHYSCPDIIGRICGMVEDSNVYAFTSTASRYKLTDTGAISEFTYGDKFSIKQSSIVQLGPDNCTKQMFLFQSFIDSKYIVVQLLFDGTVEQYPVDFSSFGLSSVTNSDILDVLSDKNGNPWIILKSKIIVFYKNSWNEFPVSICPYPNGTISSLSVDDSGAVWAVANGLSLFKDGVWKTFTNVDSIPVELKKINGLISFKGSMYISTLDGKIARYRNGSWKLTGTLPGTGEAGEMDDIHFFTNHDDKLFLSQKKEDSENPMTYQVGDSSVDIVTLYSNLPTKDKDCIIYDFAFVDSNQLCIATSCGLFKGKDKTWKVVNFGDVKENFFEKVFYEGNILYAVKNDNLYKLSSGKWQQCAASVNDMRVNALVQDKNGTLYAGTFASGLVKINALNKAVPFGTPKPSMVSSSISSMTIDRDGNLWIGTDLGLCIYNESGIKGKILSDSSIKEDTFKPVMSYLQEKIVVR